MKTVYQAEPRSELFDGYFDNIEMFSKDVQYYSQGEVFKVLEFASRLYANACDAAEFSFGAGDFAVEFSVLNLASADKEWHHIAMVRNGLSSVIYVDGDRIYPKQLDRDGYLITDQVLQQEILLHEIPESLRYATESATSRRL